MDGQPPSKIVVKTSGIHNKGVFTTTFISKGDNIIEYIGEKITKEEAEKRAEQVRLKAKQNPSNGSVYIFNLNKHYDLDGDLPHNTAKYINHSCEPNCEAIDEDGRIWIVALKKIKEGEELTYDYGYDIEDYEEHPCKCGKNCCIGYIISKVQWPKLKKRLKKKKYLINKTIQKEEWIKNAPFANPVLSNTSKNKTPDFSSVPNATMMNTPKIK